MGVAVNLTVNRTEYRGGYTKVPNSLFQGQILSMKAITLMTYLLGQRDSSYTPTSENDRWTMTLKGISHMFKESIGCIKHCMDELMQKGFVVRVDVLNKRNLRIRSEYVVFQEPIADADGKPRYVREEELRKGVTLMSVANSSSDLSDVQSEELEKDACRVVVMDMVEEDTLSEDFSPEEAKEVTDAICDVVCEEKTVYIDNEPVTPEACKEALFKLSREDVTKILDKVRERKNIQNRKHYVLACLYQVGLRKAGTIGARYVAMDEIQLLLAAIRRGELIDWWNDTFEQLTPLSQRIAVQYIWHTYEHDEALLDSLCQQLRGFYTYRSR
ncbi:hypothetical protein [Butyricicoccus sp.]|uniref:hypothetical protein n=1 Tax=Butyricicoccus sp. TaxID=2049021 RepID=UPI003D7D5711